MCAFLSQSNSQDMKYLLEKIHQSRPEVTQLGFESANHVYLPPFCSEPFSVNDFERPLLFDFEFV